ncbi:MAG: ABC transporter ATP-binding protein [Deltaproteobacteria bacterium]|nr:ABC transporter ATP-binding protein [Deltaproteobacteria bacterium]
MEPVLVELAGIAVRYDGRTVLDIPHLSVAQQEVLAVVGPNGAGKSTLLQVLSFVRVPDAGRMLYAGMPVGPHDRLPLRRRTATVFQGPLLCRGSVARNVALGLSFRGVPEPERHRRVMRWLDRLGIGHLARRPARELSGGEAQRVALARAFVLEPELLLLDEPFAALDPPTRDTLLMDLRAILTQAGTTTVFVTHDRGEALMLGDRMAVLMGGRVEQCDRPQQVFMAPATEQVATFMGVETILEGTVVGCGEGISVLEVKGIRLAAAGEHPSGTRVLACLRPEDVTLSREEGGPVPSSAGNRVRGQVVQLLPSGLQYRVVVECGVSLSALVTRASHQELGLRVGMQVLATFKASALHLISRPR